MARWNRKRNAFKHLIKELVRSDLISTFLDSEGGISQEIMKPSERHLVVVDELLFKEEEEEEGPGNVNVKRKWRIFNAAAN